MLSARQRTWRGVPLLAVVLLVISACSGPRETAEPEPEPAPVEVEPINMAEYETFDPSGYEDAPPTPPEVEHDVPDRLMEGKVTGGTSRVVQGYRVQLFSAQDKREADRVYAQAVDWWERNRRDGTLDEVYSGDPADPPVYVVYRQPYYRVRLGNFATRTDALKVLRLLEQNFSRAFVVPDRVTLTR